MSERNDSLSNLATSIKLGIESRLKDLHSGMPGIIESFDPVNQTVTVQPAIKRIFRTSDGEQEILTPQSLPLLINVPIQFPRGGGFSLTFPIAKGDECLLIFCERAIDTWHKFGGVREPNAKRFHHLSDAVALVGLSSIPNKVPSYDPTNVQIKKDDGSVYITLLADSTMDIHADGDIRVDTDGDVDVTATNLNATLTTKATVTAPQIDLTGNVTVTGTLTVTGAAALQGGAAVTGGMTNNGTNIGSTHSHTQGADSNGDTQQNVGAPF